MKASGNSETLCLKNTSGPPLRVQVAPKNEPVKGVSIADMKDWMKREGISMAQMRRNGRFIRKQFGRRRIEKYAREALVKESHSVDEFFHTEEFCFTETVKTEVRGKVKKEIRSFKRYYSVPYLKLVLNHIKFQECCGCKGSE